jgi:hypothetical protein
MSFESHYNSISKLRDKAAKATSSFRKPTVKELMSKAGRARYFKAVRNNAIRVLKRSVDAAERDGTAHGKEVVKDFEG